MAEAPEDYEEWEKRQKEERRLKAQEELAEFYAARQRELEERRRTREVQPEAAQDMVSI